MAQARLKLILEFIYLLFLFCNFFLLRTLNNAQSKGYLTKCPAIQILENESQCKKTDSNN